MQEQNTMERENLINQIVTQQNGSKAKDILNSASISKLHSSFSLERAVVLTRDIGEYVDVLIQGMPNANAQEIAEVKKIKYLEEYDRHDFRVDAGNASGFHLNVISCRRIGDKVQIIQVSMKKEITLSYSAGLWGLLFGISSQSKQEFERVKKELKSENGQHALKALLFEQLSEVMQVHLGERLHIDYGNQVPEDTEEINEE
jgi:hypothetical protein